MSEEKKAVLPQVPTKLEEIAAEQLTLARDTNEVVHSIRRMMRISFWTKLLFWALVIILPVIFIGPILKAAQSFVPTVKVGSQSIPLFTIPGASKIENAFDTYSQNAKTMIAPNPSEQAPQ